MKNLIYTFFTVIILFGCSDTTNDGGGNNGNNGNQDPPTGVFLVFPHQDSLCNEGEDPTPTESTVFFEWVYNDNAEIYTLHIENLSTGSMSQYETVDFIYPVTIQRPESFRWYVTYELNGETKESASWNFYNAGPGVQTYAPFPAEVISPIMAQNISSTTSITLHWSGSDVDDDIINYDVYFGTENPPGLSTSNISGEQITVAVVPGNIYYWFVVTKDAEGNSSESGVFQFRVLE